MTTNCLYPVGWFVSSDGTREPIPCKQWKCPSCSRVMKNKLMDRVARGFAGEEVRFLTLTMRSGSNDREIMKCYNRLRSNLSYHGYKGFKCFVVKEFTRRGVRHLHVAISAYIPQELISKCWYLATDKTSYITDIRYEDDIKNIAGYLTKYMTKSIHSGGFEKGERRYSFSRHEGFKPVKSWDQPMTKPSVLIDPHYNPASKYWYDELINPMVAMAGIYAMEYFELATMTPEALQNAVTRHADYDPPLTWAQLKEIWFGELGKPTSLGHIKYKKRKYKTKHSKSNIIKNSML